MFCHWFPHFDLVAIKLRAIQTNQFLHLALVGAENIPLAVPWQIRYMCVLYTVTVQEGLHAFFICAVPFERPFDQHLQVLVSDSVRLRFVKTTWKQSVND